MKLFRWQYEVFLLSKAKFNIVPAGRRSGKTQGAEKASIINAAQGKKILWVDTVYSNIDRYYERYFLPDLKESELDYNWNAQKKILKVEGGYIDLRSADRPENIEGFGYDQTYLNEAGIILNNDYLYTNTILPMLMDYDNSQLYAFGTPKGTINKKGEEHRFYTLWKKVLAKDKGYSGRQLSSYDNPIIFKENILELEKEIRDISEEAVRQEVYGEFVDGADDQVFKFNEIDRFSMQDFRDDLVDARIGAIDVADEGADALSFPVGKMIGRKVYITDWLFTTENTEYTIPTSTSIINSEKLHQVAIETNNHGSIFYKDVNRNTNYHTELIGVFQKANKHSRIVQKAHFIRSFFVFRNDYEVGSDYDKAMKQLFVYTKDGKAPHDDAPDSLALLASLVADYYGERYE